MSSADACAAAEAIAGNQDLLTEILVRVPAKPLIRFKCVSKRWLSLISDPNFCRRHALRHPTSKVSGVFLRRAHSEFQFVSLNGNHNPCASPFTSLDFVDDPAGIKILQSCNGLFLCSSFRRIGTPRKYYVYNPTTKQFSVLPQPDVDIDETITIFDAVLAFDPTRSPDYSVVLVQSTAVSCYYYQIMIYSSENGAWRLSGGPFIAPYDMDFGDGVYWNGSIHWNTPKGTCLCFDLREECRREMPVITHCDAKFVVACGHLHAIEMCGCTTGKVQIFQMAGDYSRWFVKYQVDIAKLAAAFPHMVRRHFLHHDGRFFYEFMVLSLVESEDGDGSSLLLHIPGKVVSYRFKDKTFSNICDIMPSRTGHSLQFGWFDAYQYFESLACVGCNVI